MKDKLDDTVAISAIKASLHLTAIEVAKLKSHSGPLLAFFDVSSPPSDVAHLLAMIMIVPALCGLHEVE